MFHISVPAIHYSCHMTEAEGEVGIPENRFKPPPPQYFNTDRSKAVLLLWFLTVTCSCCPYLYFRKVLSIYIFSYFPFGFEGRVWDLIVSVPDHCLSFYFVRLLSESQFRIKPFVRISARIINRPIFEW